MRLLKVLFPFKSSVTLLCSHRYLVSTSSNLGRFNKAKDQISINDQDPYNLQQHISAYELHLAQALDWIEKGQLRYNQWILIHIAPCPPHFTKSSNRSEQGIQNAKQMALVDSKDSVFHFSRNTYTGFDDGFGQPGSGFLRRDEVSKNAFQAWIKQKPLRDGYLQILQAVDTAIEKESEQCQWAQYSGASEVRCVPPSDAASNRAIGLFATRRLLVSTCHVYVAARERDEELAECCRKLQMRIDMSAAARIIQRILAS